MRVKKSGLSLFISLIISSILLVLIIFKLINYFGDRDDFDRQLKKSITQKEDDIIIGSSNSPLTLYMFSSYRCKFCSLFFKEVFPEIKEKYIDTGKLKMVLKLVNQREDEKMTQAIQASICLNKYSNFEKFHELLITNPNVVYTNDFQVLLDDLIAANPDIAQCLLENNNYDYIRKTNDEFRDHSLSGTPTFIIGNKIYSGFRSFEQLEVIFQKEIVNATN